MKHRQSGFFSRQTALLLSLFGLVVVFAIPKIDRFEDHTKVSEAYKLASASKIRLSEFYTLSARFPATEAEVRSVTTAIYSQPEFVDAIEVDSEDPEFDVVVRVYLEDGVAGGEGAHLFMTANRLDAPGGGLQWRCGGNGIEAEMLPRGCTG